MMLKHVIMLVLLKVSQYQNLTMHGMVPSGYVLHFRQHYLYVMLGFAVFTWFFNLILFVLYVIAQGRP
jgi:hypothetical protein